MVFETFFHRFKRFLRQFFHPGTWILFSLLAVGAAMLFPLFAPALIVFAAVAMGVATLVFVLYVDSWVNSKTPINFFPRSHKMYGRDGNQKIWQEHPVQMIIIAVGVASFIAALVLTIGFFTGGAGFAFMAPVFAAMAAPFAAAGASAGISLFLPALAGTVLLLGVLNLTNTLKRFAAWLDSFKYDYAAVIDEESEQNALNQGVEAESWPSWSGNYRRNVARAKIEQSVYPIVICKGIWSTIENGFVSPDADKLDPPPALDRDHDSLM